MQRLNTPLWPVVVLGLLWGSLVRAADYPDFVTLVEQYSPAVVSIQTKSEPKERLGRGHPPIPENSPFHDYFKRFFEQMPTCRPNRALGRLWLHYLARRLYRHQRHVVEDMDSIVVGLPTAPS